MFYSFCFMFSFLFLFCVLFYFFFVLIFFFGGGEWEFYLVYWRQCKCSVYKLTSGPIFQQE